MKRLTLNRVVEFVLSLLIFQFGLSNCTEEDGLEQLPNGKFCVFTCSEWVSPDIITEFAPSAQLIGPGQLKENLIGLACLGDDNTRDVDRFGNQLCYTGIWGAVFIINQEDYTAVMQEAESSHEKSFISFEEVMLTNPEKYMKCMTADLGALPGKYPLGRQNWDNIPNPEQDNAYYNQLENLGVPSSYINGLKALSQPDMCDVPSGDIIPVLDRTVGQSTVPEIKQEPSHTVSKSDKVPPMVLQSPASSINITPKATNSQTNIKDIETFTTRHVEGESSKVINDLDNEDIHHTNHQPVVIVTPIGPASKFGISDESSTEPEEFHESTTLPETVVDNPPTLKPVSTPSSSSNLDNKVVPVKPKEIPSSNTHEITQNPIPKVIKPVDSHQPKTHPTHSQPFIVITPISSLPSVKNLPSTTKTSNSPTSTRTFTSAPQQKAIPTAKLSLALPPEENVVHTESLTKETTSVHAEEIVISESPTPLKINEKPLNSNKSPTVLINPANSPSMVQDTNTPKPMFTLEGITPSSPKCTAEMLQPIFTLDDTSSPPGFSKTPLESETEEIPTVLINPPNSPPIIQNKHISKPMFTLEGITPTSPAWESETLNPVFTSNNIPSTVFPKNPPEIQSKQSPSVNTIPELESEQFEEVPTVIINSPGSQQIPMVPYEEKPMFTLEGISSDSSSFPEGEIIKPMFTENENPPEKVLSKIPPNPYDLEPMFTVEGISTPSSNLPIGEETKPMFTLDEDIQPEEITSKTLEVDSKSITVDTAELESLPERVVPKIKTIGLKSPPRVIRPKIQTVLKSPRKPKTTPPEIETVELESPLQPEILKTPPKTTPPEIETVELESPLKPEILKIPPKTTPPEIETVELESPLQPEILKTPPKTTPPKIETVELESSPTTVPTKIEATKLESSKIETIELETSPEIETVKPESPKTIPSGVEPVKLYSKPETITEEPKLMVQENENFDSETVKITETERESKTVKISESTSFKNDLVSDTPYIPQESSASSLPREISNFIPNSAIPGFTVAFFHPEFSDILTSELMPSHQQAMYEPDEFIPGFVFGIGVQLFS